MKQLVCSDCGWKGELDPDGTTYFGPGGTLSCPDCREAKRNGPGIESSYGHINIVDVPPFKGWLIDHHSRRQKLVHYVEKGKPICGSKSAVIGEYLRRERWILQWGKRWCPKCEAKLLLLKSEKIENVKS
jgi:glutaredoxin